MDDESCSHDNLQQVLWHQRHQQHQQGQEYHGVQGGQEPQQHRAGPVKENAEWSTLRPLTGEAALILPPSNPQQHVSHSHHILTAAPLAPVRPLAPGLPYEEKEGRKIPVNRNISLLPWLHHHSFGFFVFFHSVRLMIRATYRRSNGARKTWKTHFTTGTRGTSRARVTNRSNFTLKEGMTLGR